MNTGTLESDLTLFSGNNNIRIEFENPCGDGIIETTLNYIDCTSPVIELINPTASGSTTKDRDHEIEVHLSGSNIDYRNIETELNGKLLNKSDNNNWNFTQGTLKFNVSLINGVNQISIEVSNDCGSDSMTFTLDLEDCNAPNIVINSPTQGLTVQNSSLNLSAQIQNISGAQNLTYQLNGVTLQGINHNSSTNISYGLITLAPGDNYITISASNDCGSDVETIHVVFEECKIPNVNISSSNTEVTNDNYTFQASVGNMPTQNGITLNLNGQNINFSYNNGIVTSHVTLQPGQNLFTLLAVRPCGRDNETLTLVYNDCKAPSISIDSPSSNNVTSNQPKYQLIASTMNIDNMNQINITHNGNNIPFAFANNAIKVRANLNNGENIIKIEVENPCGQDAEIVNINFDPCLVPNISFNGNMAALSSSGFTSSQSTLPISLNIENYNSTTNVVLTNNGNVIPSHTYQISNGVLNGTVNLSNGINNIAIQAISPCGSDSENITVNYVEEIVVPDTPNPNEDNEEEPIEDDSSSDDNDSEGEEEEPIEDDSSSDDNDSEGEEEDPIEDDSSSDDNDSEVEEEDPIENDSSSDDNDSEVEEEEDPIEDDSSSDDNDSEGEEEEPIEDDSSSDDNDSEVEEEDPIEDDSSSDDNDSEGEEEEPIEDDSSSDDNDSEGEEEDPIEDDSSSDDNDSEGEEEDPIEDDSSSDDNDSEGEEEDPIEDDSSSDDNDSEGEEEDPIEDDSSSDDNDSEVEEEEEDPIEDDSSSDDNDSEGEEEDSH